MGTPKPQLKKIPKDSARWAVYAVALIFLVFAVFALILLRSGLFRFDGTAPSASVIAACLALVGGLIGSLISIVGVILKHSIDLRTTALTEQTARRLEVESLRNSALQIEAENRLKLEAGIEAVKLLGTNNSATGALFILSWLKIHDLATVLAGQMFATDQLDANSAAWLFHRSLKSGDRQLEGEVNALMQAYVEKFLMPNGQGTFPDCLLNWDLSLDPHTRYDGAITLGFLLVSRPYREWRQYLVGSFLSAFAIGWKTEPNQQVKTEIGACFKGLVEALHLPEDYELYHDTGIIPVGKLAAAIGDLRAENQRTWDLIAEFKRWVPSDVTNPAPAPSQ